MNIENLKKYKAKSDGTTIFQHNEDLLNILQQLKSILSLEEELSTSIKNSIIYHDIGKAVSSFQNKLNSKTISISEVRHEILSACIKELSDEERLSVLTHHKDLNKIISLLHVSMNKEVFKNELKELCHNLEIKEYEDIATLALKYKKDKELRKSKTSILHKGVLNLCDHIASADIKYLDIGFSANELYKFNQYTSIQERCKTTNNDKIIISPTGTGKTEASLFFADQVQNENKSRRIFYVLPYTTSITAMYKRLKQKGISVGMLHSKAEFFLYKELEDDKEKAKHQYQIFKKYINQITVCTIFQIVKAFFNCKFSEMMIAMFSNSIFIIDEIHCYQIKEFCMLVETLKYLKENYNINICIMSASIPTSYVSLMKEKLNIEEIIQPTLEEYQNLKRHRIHYKKNNIEDSMEQMKLSLIKGDKVLICVNTVEKSQQIAKELSVFAEQHGIKWKLIHGKFNMKDRSEIEEQIINKENMISLLIGTQAIEVSLDIDYDVLYTEIAPLDALLQRFGRINRKKLGEIKELKDIYIFGNETNSIYNNEVIQRTIQVIENLTIIEEEKVQSILDIVYPSINEKEYRKYEKDYHKVLENCMVGEWKEGYAYDMIDHIGLSVLPQNLINEYEQYFANKKYFEANSLLVNISEKQYKYLEKKGLIKYNQKLHTYVVLLPYDNIYGLQIKEEIL